MIVIVTFTSIIIASFDLFNHQFLCVPISYACVMSVRLCAVCVSWNKPIYFVPFCTSTNVCQRTKMSCLLSLTLLQLTLPIFLSFRGIQFNLLSSAVPRRLQLKLAQRQSSVTSSAYSNSPSVIKIWMKGHRRTTSSNMKRLYFVLDYFLA